MKLSRKLFPDVVEAMKPETEPYRLWDSCVPQPLGRIQTAGIRRRNVQWSRTGSVLGFGDDTGERYASVPEFLPE